MKTMVNSSQPRRSQARRLTLRASCRGEASATPNKGKPNRPSGLYRLKDNGDGSYGEPQLLDPKESRWEDKATRMALERPLSLRYMDMTVYGALREGAGAKASEKELDRQGFLGGL